MQDSIRGRKKMAGVNISPPRNKYPRGQACMEKNLFKTVFPQKSHSAKTESFSPLTTFIQYKNTIAYTNTLPFAFHYIESLPNTLVCSQNQKAVGS